MLALAIVAGVALSLAWWFRRDAKRAHRRRAELAQAWLDSCPECKAALKVDQLCRDLTPYSS